MEWLNEYAVGNTNEKVVQCGTRSADVDGVVPLPGPEAPSAVWSAGVTGLNKRMKFGPGMHCPNDESEL